MHVMPWLADGDVGAAYGFARSFANARTETELRRRVLQALTDLAPADILTWDRVELATRAVRHEAVPVDAELPGGHRRRDPFAALLRVGAEGRTLTRESSRTRRPT